MKVSSDAHFCLVCAKSLCARGQRAQEHLMSRSQAHFFRSIGVESLTRRREREPAPGPGERHEREGRAATLAELVLDDQQQAARNQVIVF